MAIGSSAGQSAGRGVGSILRRFLPDGRTSTTPTAPFVVPSSGASGTIPPGGVLPSQYPLVPYRPGEIELYVPPVRTGGGANVPPRPSGGASTGGAATPPGRPSFFQRGAAGVQRGLQQRAAKTPRDIVGPLASFAVTRPKTAGALLAGVLGGSYLALRDTSSAKDPDAFRQALDEMRGASQTPEELTNMMTEAYMQPYRREVAAVDPVLQQLLEAQYGPVREELTNLGARGAGAVEEGYADYAARAAAEAAALENLAAQVEGSVAGAGGAGAAAMEDVLYGGGMDVSDTSGLAPVAGYLADMPGDTRAAAAGAGADARRNLELDAQGFVRDADLMSQMGPAYSRQLADQVAMENLALQRMQSAAITEDYMNRAREQRMIEAQALNSLLSNPDLSSARVSDALSRAEAVAAAEALAQENPRLLETFFNEWVSGDEAVYAARNLDFVDYIAARMSEIG